MTNKSENSVKKTHGGSADTEHATVVLHVVDRVEGGVPAAVASYIRNSPPGFRHHIIAPCGDSQLSGVWRGLDAVQHDLGSGLLRRVNSVRRAARQVNAQVVHAHSSFSGVYARLAVTRMRRIIVHTPHGYGFQRRDISLASRMIFWLIEFLLGANTTRVAACSPIEARYARKVPSIGSRIVRVPNVASVERNPRDKQHIALSRVGMAGRISTAKDPAYFVALIHRMRQAIPGIEAVWLGGGDDKSEELLRSHGVRVTGWLDGDALVRELDALDLYVHSSAWESFPIAVLDAHARGLPIVVRDISAFDDVDESLKVEDAIPRLLRAENMSEVLRQNTEYWMRYLHSNNAHGQKNALMAAWSEEDLAKKRVRA